MKKKRTVSSLIAEKKRKEMLEAGAYDGRYKQRSVKNKKKYSRKSKNKPDEE